MNDKVVSLEKYKKYNKLQKIKSKSKMFFLVIMGAIFVALISWHFFVENVAKYDVDIAASNNINYKNSNLIAVDSYKLSQLVNEDIYDLNIIYLFTTWCKGCVKNFKNINEIAREFQNSNLNFIAIAIDNNNKIEDIENYFAKYDEIYFKKYYLNDIDNLGQLLQENNIQYKGAIPFMALYDKNNDLIENIVGPRSHKYLRRKIINSLFNN